MEKTPSYIITGEEGLVIGHMTITLVEDYEIKIGRLYKITRGIKPPLFDSFPFQTEDHNIARELLNLGGYFKKFTMKKEMPD
jgi:hypothetical protein